MSGFAGHHVPSLLALFGAMAAMVANKIWAWSVFFSSRDNRRRCWLFVFVPDIVKYLFMLVRSMGTRIPQARQLGLDGAPRLLHLPYAVHQVPGHNR